MTDPNREMLELAAKAAGIQIDKSEHNGGGQGNDGFDILGNAVLDWHNDVRWNPLTNPGDALRLAVKLGLLVYVLNDIGVSAIRFPHTHVGGKYDVVEPHGSDPLAATCLAITRAAAEIGRRMTT